MAAAEGYPEAPRKGDAIRIDLPPSPNHQLFHAGTRRDSSGELLTSGGRVLAVVAQGDDFDAAFARGDPDRVQARTTAQGPGQGLFPAAPTDDEGTLESGQRVGTGGRDGHGC